MKEYELETAAALVVAAVVLMLILRITLKA